MSLFLPGVDTLFESGLDNLIQHMRTNAVVTNCQVIAHVGPDMGVRVTAGTIQANGLRVAVAQTDLVVAASGANPRLDLVHVDMTTGVPAIITGTGAATPKPPALPANSIELGLVGVGVGAINIQTSNIADRRLIQQFSAGFGAVYVTDGSAAAPTLSFSNSQNMGFLRSNATTMTLAISGVTHTFFAGAGASAVNLFQFANANSGVPPSISVLGSDANIALTIISKGTGTIDMYSNTKKAADFYSPTTSSDTFLRIQAGVASVLAYATGATDASLSLSSNGTGTVFIGTGGTTRNVAEFVNVASSVNYLQIAPNAAGASPSIIAVGNDTNISFNLMAKGTGSVHFFSGQGARVLGSFVDVASAVNKIQLAPSATGSAPRIDMVGTDTNIDFVLAPKGTGVFHLSYAAVALGGGAGATLGTIGGSGPSAAGQNEWGKVKWNGNTRYIPLWA